MSRSLRLRCVALLVCLGLLLPAKPARAESIGEQVALVIVAIVAVTAAITVAIVVSVRRSPSLTGCLSDGPGGLEIEDAGDSQTYLLTGDTVGLKPGERVKLQGKKKGKDATGSHHFFVEKFKKDYGVCHAATPTP